MDLENTYENIVSAKWGDEFFYIIFFKNKSEDHSREPALLLAPIPFPVWWDTNTTIVEMPENEKKGEPLELNQDNHYTRIYTSYDSLKRGGR